MNGPLRMPSRRRLQRSTPSVEAASSGHTPTMIPMSMPPSLWEHSQVFLDVPRSREEPGGWS